MFAMQTASGARHAFRQLNIPGEAQQNQQLQQQIGQIDLPPVPLIGSRSRLGVVIVVPPFTAGDDGYPCVEWS
jgi:hypothetical protein